MAADAAYEDVEGNTPDTYNATIPSATTENMESYLYNGK